MGWEQHPLVRIPYRRMHAWLMTMGMRCLCI